MLGAQQVSMDTEEGIWGCVGEGAGEEEQQFMKGLSGDKEGIKSLDFMPMTMTNIAFFKKRDVIIIFMKL